MKELLNNILSLPRYLKRLIAIITDAGLCYLCLWLSLILRLEKVIYFKDLFNEFWSKID